MIEPWYPELSIRTQCALLQLNRSTYYDQFGREEVSQADSELMKEIDKLYTQFPYYGSRKIAKHLSRSLGEPINRKRIARLMGVMDIQAIYPKPNLSKPAPGHKIYPYLLKGITATYPNHIWGVDITYVPLKGGWLYLVAIMDWYSRYVLSWELSDSLSVEFCCQALKAALEINFPQVHNSDQGSQFTSEDYLGLLLDYPEIAISMDHRGRCFDNIFIERLWRSVKHEEIYLHDYQSPAEAKKSIANYFDLYNYQRLHQVIGYLPPAEVYFGR